MYACPADWGGDFQTIRQLSRSCRGEAERAAASAGSVSQGAAAVASADGGAALEAAGGSQPAPDGTGDAADPGGLLRASLAGEGEYQWTGTSAPGKKDSSAARRLLRALRPLTQRALREARKTQPESDGSDDEDSDE